MAPSTPDSQSILRPTMRRKSSAQNLLSSFRPGTSSSTSSSNANNANTTTNTNNNTTTTTAATSAIAPGSNSNGINGTHVPPLLPAHILSAPLPPTPAPPPSSYVPPSAPTSALPTPSTSGTSTPSHPQFSALHHAQQQQSAFVALGGPASAAAVAATMREWDAQSMQAADAQSQFMPLVAGGSSPGATVEYLRDLVQKRIITLTYMRNVHDGCVLLCYATFFAGWC